LDETLRSLGHERLIPSGRNWKSPSTGEIEPDFRDPVYLRWLEGANVDVFFHAGALVGTTRCEAHAEDAWSCNVEAVRRIADILSRRRIYTVFYATAAEMEPGEYGLDRPIDVGRTPRNPLTRYGITKLAGRELMEVLFRERGVEELLLQVYPSFGFGGARDGNSCVADLLKCALGVYDRRPFLPLAPENIKEVTPHSYIAELSVRAAERRLSGKIPIASGVWTRYAEIVEMVEDVTGEKLDPEWRADLDYKGDFLHVREDVFSLAEDLGVPVLTRVEIKAALVDEMNGILNAEGAGVMANHEWRFAEKLVEAFPGWEGRR